MSANRPDSLAGTTNATLGASAAFPDITGTVGSSGPSPSVLRNRLAPSLPSDNLNRGKEHFRQGDYGLAEQYFRRSVEAGPRDAESWLGLAASYDRLRRFDLADRAYGQLLEFLGPTPSVLNNIGFSYMLRGDFTRARTTLLSAQAKDPKNPYIKNNLALLEESVRKRKAVR